MDRVMFVAIDGGGTKTDAIAFTASGRVIASARAGRCLPQIDGIPAALDVIEELLGRVASHARPDAIGIFISGLDLAQEEQTLRAAIDLRDWTPRTVVENDTFALLRTGTAEPDAIAVVCGTGLNAVGVTSDGRRARFPALGRISGDWGGGSDLALDMLWHAARSEDGRDEHTALEQIVAEAFRVATVREVYEGLHLGLIPETSLALLPPLLFAAADAGDAVCAALVARQAAEIVSMARVALTRLNLLAAPTPIVLGGSVLAARHPRLNDAVRDGIAAIAPLAVCTVVTAPPVIGSCLLTWEAAMGVSAPASISARLAA